jgi:adenine deaminase
VARHYGLDIGLNRVGAIAPGYQADLILMEDIETCGIAQVLKRGKWSSEISRPEALKMSFGNSVKIRSPEVSDFEAAQGRVNVIGIIPGKIITEHRVMNSQDAGVAKLSVLERYGKGSKPANGYVEGFGEDLSGAIASSVGHDSHNLIAVGSTSSDMRVAMMALNQTGGGFCVVKDGKVLSHLPLPLGGLMSEQSPSHLRAQLEDLKAASRSVGCTLHEPFLQLAFLSLPVIPSLKLTDQGLIDVNAFKKIDVRAT